MSEPRMPVAAVFGLGATQIIGYGTLYYAFSILVPDIARDIGRSESWVFGAFSVALLIGGWRRRSPGGSRTATGQGVFCRSARWPRRSALSLPPSFPAPLPLRRPS